ncbi:Protein CLEC16A, partial [Mucuna pruriens]
MQNNNTASSTRSSTFTFSTATLSPCCALSGDPSIASPFNTSSKYVANELRKIEVVDRNNREVVLDLLQSVAEIVTYGDRQNPHIFECFMERQVLADFVRILKISQDSKIEAPLLQYLSIMIQNMDIFILQNIVLLLTLEFLSPWSSTDYCLSNGYINSIILHPYKFDGGDLAPYYVSFLRAISGKINRDTLCLLVNVQGGEQSSSVNFYWIYRAGSFLSSRIQQKYFKIDAVVSFPLYTEALRFAQHEEKMIQTAIRALVLNIYNVSDGMVYQFISTPPVSEYFSDLVRRLRDLCFRLDAFVYDKGKMDSQKRRNGIILESDKFVDELYYFKDILSVGEPCLIRLVMENLLNGLVFPVLCSFMASKNKNYLSALYHPYIDFSVKGSDLSAITSLYILSRLLQVVGRRSMINNVAGVILYHFLNLNVRVPSEGTASDVHDDAKTSSKCLKEVERVICYAPELNGSESINGTYLGAHWEGFMSSFNINSSNGEICSKRSGIFAFAFCEDHNLLLASIFLLLILIESKDLDYLLSPMIGLYEMGDVMLQSNDSSTSKSVDGSIFIRFMPEILNALLKVLASQQPLSIMMLWHAGWCMQKLLNFHREGLNGDNLLLFTVLPCRLDEIVCEWAAEIEEPYFYLYETLFSKLGIQLPFTDFEQAALRALNVAPTQLHPNNWAFVRAFELLCEDMGREPSLSILFWFFSLRRVDKPTLARKLMKPFRESYKQFKDHFFWVVAERVGTNLLFGEFGEPLFLLYWSDQPAILVTIDRDHLEGWEEEFIVDLNQLPTLSCSKLISAKHGQTSYDQSCVNFLKELDGVWLDHIPDAIITELASCKRGQTSYFAWQRMVDAVKAFILHYQLKTFIFKGVLAEKPLLNMISSSTNDSGVIRTSDVSSASFGSNVSLVSGIPCGIAFSNSEIRDIYIIPVASGIIGKLLLAEKHPFRSRHGVVIAIAPLAGLCPKIDEDHPSWLHLRIREFDPQFYSIKARGNHITDHLADGRWTLGFPNARACEEAQLAILNEIAKQRSAVEYMLAPLLQHDDLGLAETSESM